MADLSSRLFNPCRAAQCCKLRVELPQAQIMAEDAAAGLARQPKKLSHRVVVAASGGNNKAVSVTTAGELSLT